MKGRGDGFLCGSLCLVGILVLVHRDWDDGFALGTVSQSISW